MDTGSALVYRIRYEQFGDHRFSCLAGHLGAFEIRTVADQGWAGIINGQLLSRAAAEFDVFVTVDRNLPFQQHLPKFDIAVILLRAKTNRVVDLVALAQPRVAQPHR